VIGKVTRGRDVGGLLRYLFGRGRRNEHTRPHLVAGWDEPAALEPAWSNGRADTKPLATLLEQPLRAANGRLDDRPVWQCSVRAAPEDRVLGDQEWEQVARDVVARAGFAPEGDDDACRWVAIRHADDHIHLVVTLARQDGRPVTPRNDYYRVGEACRAAEKLLNLRATARRDRTAASQPSYGEREKAHRHGLPEPARITLRRQVRTAAAASGSADDFLQRLSRSGGAGQGTIQRTQPRRDHRLRRRARGFPCPYLRRRTRLVWRRQARRGSDPAEACASVAVGP
jgi:MobA/VirD2-like, nuclease domain